MTKTINALILLLALSGTTYAQVDTMYVNNEKIPCSIAEITPDAIKYKYPGEDLVNSVYKNSVQKIVFKSGRIQIFAEATSFKDVNNVDEYENVTIAGVESEVRGLYKIGDVSSKAVGTTMLSSQERVKARAYRKLKMQAAMMGANVIYLTNQKVRGNENGGYLQAGNPSQTNLTGLAYTNLIPNIEEFKKLISGRNIYGSVLRYKLWASDSEMSKESGLYELKIEDIINDNGVVTVRGDLEGVKKYRDFRLARFNKDSFSLYYKDKSTAYCYVFSFR